MDMVKEGTQDKSQIAREALSAWLTEIGKNIYTNDFDYIHSIKFYFAHKFENVNNELKNFGEAVVKELEPLVKENNLAINLPRLEEYNSIGERIDKIIHHPTYVEAGDIIYRSNLLKKMSSPGGLLECLSILFLSGAAGEAGHNCPIACSAGIIRVLQKTPDFPDKEYYLNKLTSPSFRTNFTGAQFLTEIQGGSDVGLNATYAEPAENNIWRIYGEKWFCSNAGADLIFVTARFDKNLKGTNGLGLFLIPSKWKDKKNHYRLRRLKDKIGTRSMATAEIDFQGAYAIAIGDLSEGFHIVMDNVLHLSRLFNTFCVLGMARRAYKIAHAYAEHRVAFANAIINYPLIRENLAKIKAENSAMLAGAFKTARMQDQFDLGELHNENTKLLLRLLVNIQKYLSAYWSVQHIHHSLDVLAGNGTIENFSSIPRLLRDCIVCENWEGTHNVLRMQVLKDIHKYKIDQIFLDYMQNELQQLTDHSYYNELHLALERLKKTLLEFNGLDKELQSIKIRFIVDEMAILYCGVHLLNEGIDQDKTNKTTSKLDCYRYFSLLHIEKKDIAYDHHYLNLITRVIT